MVTNQNFPELNKRTQTHRGLRSHINFKRIILDRFREGEWQNNYKLLSGPFGRETRCYVSSALAGTCRANFSGTEPERYGFWFWTRKELTGRKLCL